MSKIYDKTAGALKATTIDTKIIDAQKVMVWDGSSDISKRINLLDVIKEEKITPYHEQVSATNATAQGECSGFKIATENVPHEWRIEKIEIPVLNTVTVEHYLGAYIVTGDNKEAILSDNATAWTSGTIATWTFKNNPIKVPTGSSLELYIITGADGLGQTEGTRSGHKIKTYYNSNGTGFMRYDGVPYGNRDVLCTFSCGDVKLDELKELSSKVAELNDEKIDTLISDLSTYNRYETNYFSTNIEGTNGAVSSFRFGFKHFPHGLVKSVSLYGRDAITSNIPEAHTTGCYLMANIYKQDGTLVSSTSSTNKLVAQFRPNSSTIVLNTWEFDNLVTPKEDEVIKFIPSPDGVTQVANYNLGILVDSYHTHEDCMCGGDSDFVNDPLASGSKWLAIAIIEGDFIHDNENQNHFTDSTKHLKSVERSVIESLYTPTNVLAWDNNYNNEALGVASMKGFIISRPYITNGKFVEVRWTSQGTATNAAVHMKITLRDTNGAPIKSYVSHNSENFSVAGLKSYRFNEEWEVDDSISSISFEPCNEDGTIRTDVQIRTRVIGNAADNDSDGSESTNANYKINVQFYKIGSVTNKFTSHVGNDTHLTTEQKNAISDYTSSKNSYAKNATLFGGEHRTATGNDNTQSWSAVRIPSAYVPHLQPIHEIKLTTLNTNETTPMYLGAVAISDNEQERQLLKLSTNAVTWTANGEVKWEFGKDGFIIPIGYQLELYLVANESDFVLPIPTTDVLLQCSMNGSIGVGKLYPIGGTWGGPRLLDCVLVTNAHIKDDTHLTEEEKAALQQLVQGSIAVREITIIDDDANAVSLLGENYEEIEDEGIVLKLEDSLDNTYLMCSENDLVDATDYLELDVNINYPEELGKKLVRRYLVVDLRNMEDTRNIVTVFPENVRWSSQIPVIQASKFYVISFQRFAKDLVVANVELYLAD